MRRLRSRQSLVGLNSTIVIMTVVFGDGDDDDDGGGVGDGGNGNDDANGLTSTETHQSNSSRDDNSNESRESHPPKKQPENTLRYRKYMYQGIFRYNYNICSDSGEYYNITTIKVLLIIAIQMVLIA